MGLSWVGLPSSDTQRARPIHIKARWIWSIVSASVEVPAVKPTVAKSLEPGGIEVGGRLARERRACRSSRHRATSSRVLFECRPPTTTTASTRSSSSSRACWCSLVGKQTVSMNLISAAGFCAAMALRIAATRRSVAVVWQTIPSASGRISRHFIGRFDHIEAVEIFGNSVDLDVSPAADHQHMIAFALAAYRAA